MINDGGNPLFQHLRRAKSHSEPNLFGGKVIEPGPDSVQPVLEPKRVTKACSEIFRRVSMSIGQTGQYQTSPGIQSPSRGRFDSSVRGNSRNGPIFDKHVGGLKLTGGIRQFQDESALDEYWGYRCRSFVYHEPHHLLEIDQVAEKLNGRILSHRRCTHYGWLFVKRLQARVAPLLGGIVSLGLCRRHLERPRSVISQ